MKRILVVSLLSVFCSTYPMDEDNVKAVAARQYALQCTLTGHNEMVCAVAPMYRTELVSGSRDNTIKEWDLVIAKVVRTFAGHKDFVSTITTNRQIIVSGSADSTVKVWDVREPRESGTYQGHANYSCVYAVAPFMNTPSNYDYFSGGTDAEMHLWDLRTFKQKSVIRRDDSVLAIAMHDDYVIGSAGKDMKLYDLCSWECIAEFEGHQQNVRSVIVDPKTMTIVSGSNDHTIKLWKYASQLRSFSKQAIKTLPGHKDRVNSVAMGPEELIISGSCDCHVHVWDKNTGNLVQILDGHAESVQSVASQGDCIISGSADNTIKVWK